MPSQSCPLAFAGFDLEISNASPLIRGAVAEKLEDDSREPSGFTEKKYLLVVIIY